MITSAKNAGWASDIAIPWDAGAGLPAPSIVRPAKLATIDVSLVLRTLGTLPAAQWDQTQAFFRDTLGLYPFERVSRRNLEQVQTNHTPSGPRRLP